MRCVAFRPLGGTLGLENYGKILDTPKIGWADFPLIDCITRAFAGVPITLETDANAAVLAEATLGAGKSLQDIVYITNGTGIGGSILSGGRLIHGALHPEFGHFKVPRSLGDSFPGVYPFHRDCIESLASGPAIAGCWDKTTRELPEEHPAWDTQAWYLAHGILALLAIVSP